jgi:aryl-alcohol dehydrogenase-like predicted oxidoreductase
MKIALGTIPFGTTVSREDSFAILDRFAEAGGTMLAWVLADGHVPIVGVSSLDQLDEAVAAADVKLGDDLRARLDAAC